MSTALVIGAGIAGPVAALALQQVGIEAILYEAAEPGAETGIWIGVQANGLDALAAVGARDAVADLGVETTSITFRTHTGRLLGELPTGRARPGAPGGRSMKRSELYRTLRGLAAERGIQIRTGQRLVGLHHAGSGVRARFENGETATGDLLLGCDGIHSTVRAALDPHAPASRYVPMLNVGGYADAVPAGARPGTLTMTFGRQAFFGYLVGSDGRSWWFANPPRRREPAHGELAGMSDEQWRATLHALYARDNSPARQLIDATPGPIRGWTTHDLPRVPIWHDDRTVLLGDAAHAVSPSTGQGSSMAIEDAVVLARCLRDLPAPVALARYEALRRPRVERVVAEGHRSSRLRSPGPLTRTIRGVVLPYVLRLAASTDASSWMHDHHIEWDEPAVS